MARRVRIRRHFLSLDESLSRAAWADLTLTDNEVIVRVDRNYENQQGHLRIYTTEEMGDA